MANSLLDVDKRVCDYLSSLYHPRFRHSVVCHEIPNDEKYIYKEHTYDYKLVNPHGTFKPAEEEIGFSYFFSRENGIPISEYIDKIKIEIRKDNNPNPEISNGEGLLSEDELDEKIDHYNVMARLSKKVDFIDNIEVKMQVRVKVLKDDPCFSKRIRRPVKNFRLDYSYNNGNDGVKLVGQLFGTEIKQSDIQIKYMSDTHISIETFDWLLPSNGAIVVTTKK